MIQQSQSWGFILKYESSNSRRYMHPSVHSSTIYNSQDMEATYVSINRYIWASWVAQLVNKLPTKAEDAREVVSIPGLGRCPGE